MKKSFFIILVINLVLSFNLRADEFTDGVRELNRGEFHAAKALFEPLVEEGYAPAQYQLGQMYLFGYGVPKDANKAFQLTELAAAQHYPDALFSLSLMYSEGTLVPKDPIKAFNLMRIAADKELASAQFNLALMYANGEGTKVNYYQASRLYRQAAMQNYALAQYNLALLYAEGKGVEKSTYQSFIWNSLAAKSGYKNAEISRDIDARDLSVEDIKSAHAEANALYAKIIEQIELKDKLAEERLKL